ncbi:MAG: alpha-L-fucosidase [Candidatus Nealsonbacteria bacterium]|nr:alpha-L-fucosidase [Candidatus Nealsonbacteria bacterium]
MSERFDVRWCAGSAPLLLVVFLATSHLDAAEQQPAGKKYEPNFASLDTVPMPAWFNEAKFGIFVVWGPYSVPAWTDRGYAEWYGGKLDQGQKPTAEFHAKNYGKDFKYEQFAGQFKAELWDPDAWAQMFARSGARYVVTTAVYHDGYCLWPSPYAKTVNTDKWNSVVTGPKRDLLGELGAACERHGVKPGIYYSLMEWWHPLYASKDPEVQKRYATEHLHPQFKDVVTKYKPWFIFLDGEWNHEHTFWKSEELAAWLFNESPVRDTVVTNDRWGKTRGKHGMVFSSEYGGGKGWGDHPWQEDRGIGRSYGYNRREDLDDYDSPQQLVRMLVKVASNGGNLLLDVGPTADGRIPVIMQQRLRQIGQWLAVNGEAIYGTRRWKVTTGEGKDVRYTVKGDDLYAICTAWPGPTLSLTSPKPAADAKITMLGHDEPIAWQMQGEKLVIEVPQLTVDRLPCLHAWVFKIPDGR